MDNMNVNNNLSGQYDTGSGGGMYPPYGTVQDPIAQQAKVIQHVPMQQKPINSDIPMDITSVIELQKYAGGIVVRLPDFSDGQPFVAKVRRPSMMALAKQGKIPNALLNSAAELFTKGGTAVGSNESLLHDMYDICRIICKASLVSPTLDEIEAAGLELADDQIMAIFNYSQIGVRALSTFRSE